MVLRFIEVMNRELVLITTDGIWGNNPLVYEHWFAYLMNPFTPFFICTFVHAMIPTFLLFAFLAEDFEI